MAMHGLLALVIKVHILVTVTINMINISSSFLVISDSKLGSESKGSGMVVNVISHEGGDHVVGMVVQRLHSQLARVSSLGSGTRKVLRL